jgi:signal transduction histidine kinase
MDTVLNTCYETTQSLRVIANYSHVIPVVLSVALGLFVLIKAKSSLLSRIFLSFIFAFSAWLIGDLIIWGSNDYHLIYAIWSVLVHFEVIFFVLALYFVAVFIQRRDLPLPAKVLLLGLTLIPFVVTILGKSVTGFDQSVCEAINNTFLDTYKVVIEGGILGIIFLQLFRPFLSKTPWSTKRIDFIVFGSIFLFLATFGITEYLASITGIYEINLYSLFVLPVFLLGITYAIFELDIFHFHLLGTHYLVFGLTALIAGQLFFTATTSDRLLTITTLIFCVGLSIILFRNLKRETDQRIRIENLSEALQQSKMRLEQTNLKLEDANDRLQSLDKLKTEFLSLASHQLRSPLTAVKGYTSMLLEGDFGQVTEQQKGAIDRVYQAVNHLTHVVEDLLNVTKIELGGMQYKMSPFDLGASVEELVKEIKITAEKKGLKLSYTRDMRRSYSVYGDEEKLRQVFLNFIDNAIKYTEKGEVAVSVSKDSTKNTITFAVTDTGMGMDQETIQKLFNKFERTEASMAVNHGGSGLGLYLAKQIVDAHHGKLEVSSPGVGKGSTFGVVLSIASPSTSSTEWKNGSE